MAHVDLHCHSTASDGECVPAEVARRARAAGLTAIALTDHDTTAGVAEAATEGAALGVRVICGCEFSTRAPWGELHLLGYFLDPEHEGLQSFLVGRAARVAVAASRWWASSRRAGNEIDLADLEEQVGAGVVGRPHVARALVERGASADINGRLTATSARSYRVRREAAPSLVRVTELVHEVGGLAVAAHLGTTALRDRFGSSRCRDSMASKCAIRVTPATEARLPIAERLGLGMSGGSLTATAISSDSCGARGARDSARMVGTARDEAAGGAMRS
jgi:predicted metal-dependent phosphoesterase TrpH